MLNPMAVNLKIGNHLGKHRILEELGEGPMSHVYLADDQVLFRQVALKVLKPEFAKAGPVGETVEEEVSSAAVLLHTGIVPLYGMGFDQGYHYFCMALMPGGNLRGQIEAGMDGRKALSILNQVTRALAFAHSKGINHQGIKPENILFRKDGSAVLADFNAVKMHGFGIGTLEKEAEAHPHYISPEQIQNSGKQFGRSDLYSLGIVLYEMLTGRVPYEGEKAQWQHVNSPVPQLPAALAEFQPLIDRLLSKKPADRFQDANQLLKAIEEVSGKLKISGGSKITLLPVGEKSPAPDRSRPTPPPPEAPSAAKRPPVAPAPELPSLPETKTRAEDPHAEPLQLQGETKKSAIPAVPKTVVPSPPQRRPAYTAPEGASSSVSDKPTVAGVPFRRRHAWIAALLVTLAGAAFLIWNGGRSPDAETAAVEVAPALPEISETLPPLAPGETSRGAAAPAEDEEVYALWRQAENALREDFARSVAYFQEGQDAEAERLLRQITRRFPQLPEPYNNLAVLYAAERRLDDSQEMLEQALRTRHSYSAIYDNLNTVQLEMALGEDYLRSLQDLGEPPPAPRLQLLPDLSAPFAELAAQGARESLQDALAPASKEVSSPPAAPSSAVSDRFRSATAHLGAWAEAWSAQDVDRYLSFYSPDFRPEAGMSLESWRAQRERNVSRPSRIEVSLSEPSVTELPSGLLRVMVVQDYRSDIYRDSTLKEFLLQRREGRWFILEENSLGTFR